MLGPNRGGEFGDGSPDFHVAWTPRSVPQWGSVRQIRGGIPSCAVRSDGKVECAGRPRFRSIAEDPTAPGGLPVVVSGLEDMASVAAGAGFTCALRKDGAVFCWGMNDDGQLGNGSGDDEEKPVRVHRLPPVVEIAAGTDTACARAAQGGVFCWGSSLAGYRGRRLAPQMGIPVPIEGTSQATQLSIGDRVACAVIAGGEVRCWGEASYDGQLGDGTDETRPTEALPVACIRDAAQVSVGDNHSCAALRDGTVRCWGSGPYGAIGDGTQENRSIPVAVIAAIPAGPPPDRCPPGTTFHRGPTKDKPEETEEYCEEADGKREGRYASRWASGGILEEGNYRAGERDGDWLVHYEHGDLVSENHYDRGVPVGVWIAYSLRYTFAFATCFERGERRWQVTSEREAKTRSMPLNLYRSGRSMQQRTPVE